MPRPRPFRALGLTTAIIFVLATACGTGASTPNAPVPSRNLTWIISGDDLAALRTSNAGLARRFFDNPRTFVIGTRDEQDQLPSGYQARPALLYPSLAALRDDIARQRIDDSIRALIYDPELWAATPLDEQRDPSGAIREFINLARREGYVAIAAPGRDLTLSPAARCGKQPGEVLDEAYVRCKIPDASAQASFLVVQTAPAEESPSALRRLLTGVSGQLGDPSPNVIATISTSPGTDKRRVWPATLISATRTALRHSQGLMLNSTPQSIGLLADYLRDMERLGHVAAYAVPGSGRALAREPTSAATQLGMSPASR